MGICASVGIPFISVVGNALARESDKGVLVATLSSDGRGDYANGLGFGISDLAPLVSATWRSAFVGGSSA